MSATVLYMSMSLDGFIAGPNAGPDNGLGDGGDRLHEWFMISIDPDGSIALETIRRSGGVNGQIVDESMSTGAVVAGRGTFEPAGGWGGDHHDGVPIFILYRREPGIDIGEWPLVTPVDDITTAMNRAKEAAGDENVLVHGAGIAQLALAAGVQNFSISLDGFGTGEGLSHNAYFGHAGHRLHEWMIATRWWKLHAASFAPSLHGAPGGSGGVDDAFAQVFDSGVGAEIMGPGKFGPPGWHEEDPEWKGAWGANPPFHTPTFILTHHTRPSIEMEGGTTFHFVDASPAKALETARDAADGQDVRLGGGPTLVW